MKKTLLILVIFTISQASKAQNYTHEFGKYSSEEFDLKQYDKDPSAEAVVIYDIGKSYFSNPNGDFVLIYERRTKIKILSKAGLKWAQIAIPFYEENNEYEQITDIKGNTYNLENGVVRTTPLDPKNTYEEKISEHWYDKKIAMPDVKEGSIIEISYFIKSPYLFNFRGWEFQQKIPVIFSEYTALMNPFYEYTYLLQGANKFDVYNSHEDSALPCHFAGIEYKNMVYVFGMKNLPAFKDESFITSTSDYIIKLNYQLSVIHYPNGVNKKILTTWPKVTKELIDNESFGKYAKQCKRKTQETVDSLHLALLPPMEKATILDRYVKSNFSWNEWNDVFTSKNVKEFLKTKTGNCADINLFLVGMLNAAGIEAHPVILSTRTHGKIKIDYPFMHFFNYVIVAAEIDSTTILLDATEPLSRFSEIPSRCLNDMGLIIQEDKLEWATLKSNSVSTVQYNFSLEPKAEIDSIYQKCVLTTTGYQASEYRSQFSSNFADLKIQLLGNNASPSDSLEAKNLTLIEKPFEINFKNTRALGRVENKIIVSPFGNTTITENPLKQPSRKYPIDFTYRKSNKFNTNILIPKGYKLLTKPENTTVNNDKIKIVYMTSVQNADYINVIGLYEFKKDQYQPSDYLAIKDYFDTIVSKFNESLVFIKE